MLQSVLNLLPILLPALIAINVVLGGLGQLLSAIHQNGAAGVVGSVAGWLKKLVDLVGGNVAH